EPACVFLAVILFELRLELQAGRLQFTKGCDGWCGLRSVAVQEIAFGSTEPQRAHARLVVHAQQVIPIGERTRPSLLGACARVLAPLHQYPTPSVRRGIQKNAEIG